MASRTEEMWVWTGYFDARLSRSEGRRVPKEAAIANPTLEAVAWAARAAGITRMRRKPETSHPSRPYSQEGTAGDFCQRRSRLDQSRVEGGCASVDWSSASKSDEGGKGGRGSSHGKGPLAW
ncbi:MAG: signal recognition particle subunit SRP19/SEC65 family protein [Candidatus Thalassarchaeaceae archaeon]